MKTLQNALSNPVWVNHKIGDTYTMDGTNVSWKIAYYPIFENGKNGDIYNEPRVLVESPITNGIDFREVPLRYLVKNG